MCVLSCVCGFHRFILGDVPKWGTPRTIGLPFENDPCSILLDSNSTQSLTISSIIVPIDFPLGIRLVFGCYSRDVLYKNPWPLRPAAAHPSFPRLAAPWPPKLRWSAEWPPSAAAWPSQPGRWGRPAAASPPRRGRPCLPTERTRWAGGDLFGSCSEMTETNSIFRGWFQWLIDLRQGKSLGFPGQMVHQGRPRYSHRLTCHQPRYPWWSYWSPPQHPSRSWTCHWRPCRTGCLDEQFHSISVWELDNSNRGP